MKTIGMLGGMSWESTAHYYSAVNQGVQAALGGHHSAKIAMVSVDFEDIKNQQYAGDWAGAAATLAEASRQIEAAGADFLLICTNTMHKSVPEIEAAISIPVLHIADATAAVILGRGIKKVGLLGTSFTMEQDFYKGRLKDKFGIEVVIPGAEDRDLVNSVIYDELCLGALNDDSRAAYVRIIEGLRDEGAEAVILGCTEIGLLVGADDTDVPLLDTTEIHAEAAVNYALAD
ncbi:aspartate/glutamate racemase family protein [Kordiimonas marina]|uniref:aspartate/glutamate racemase family protein n=1 Tax=Kordiimonas marina TaxID=2872312 RepID=UPI001FF17DDA|nr:aspartate/glutamate racemase family protein [Kordiimonas marina]MCJ9430000.1 aspartate/glutamate racemase family protein [Kordiimonas marina]